MPEIKKSLEFDNVDMDYSVIPFKDSIREKARLEKLKKLAALKAQNLQKKFKKESVAWSVQKDTKQKKIDRKEKKVRKKEAILNAKQEANMNGQAAEKKGKRQVVDEDEWKELQDDARKAKKAKKNKNAVFSSDEDDMNSDGLQSESE